nr:hypothetical protein CFP56_59181 [Quercus suber]
MNRFRCAEYWFNETKRFGVLETTKRVAEKHKSHSSSSNSKTNRPRTQIKTNMGKTHSSTQSMSLSLRTIENPTHAMDARNMALERDTDVRTATMIFTKIACLTSPP